MVRKKMEDATRYFANQYPLFRRQRFIVPRKQRYKPRPVNVNFLYLDPVDRRKGPSKEEKFLFHPKKSLFETEELTEGAEKGKPQLPKLTIQDYDLKSICVEKPIDGKDISMILKKPPAPTINQLREIRPGHRDPFMLSGASTIHRIDPDLLKTEDELAEEKVPLKPRDPLLKFVDKGIASAKVLPTIINMMQSNCQKWNLKPMKETEWLNLSLEHEKTPQRSQIIMEAMRICKREVNEKDLANIRKVSDLIKLLQVEMVIPVIEGNPLDEVFRGVKLPPNVSIRIALDRKTKIDARSIFPTSRPLYELHMKNQ